MADVRVGGLVALLLFLSGCCPRAWQARAPSVLTEAELSCGSDSECAIVEDACGCSSGGEKFAVPARSAAEATRRLKLAFGDAACPDVLSGAPSCRAKTARCVERRCVLGDGAGP